jgi:hypothetical protein
VIWESGIAGNVNTYCLQQTAYELVQDNSFGKRGGIGCKIEYLENELLLYDLLCAEL